MACSYFFFSLLWELRREYACIEFGSIVVALPGAAKASPILTFLRSSYPLLNWCASTLAFSNARRLDDLRDV